MPQLQKFRFLFIVFVIAFFFHPFASAASSFKLYKNAITTLKQQHKAFTQRKINNLQGYVEIRAALMRDGKGEHIEYLLLTDDHEYYYLNFSDHAPTTLTGGSRIRIAEAYMIAIADSSRQLYLRANDLIVEMKMTALPDTIGPQNTIVFLINFTSAPNSMPFTAANVNSVIFTNVSNLYKEFSFGNTSVVGNVVGYYTLALNGAGDCTTMTNGIPDLAQAAAIAAGVNLAPYKHRVYLFPLNSNCSYGGLGTVGSGPPGAWGNVWLNGWLDVYPGGHELGHNLGLWHANRYDCTTSPIAGCTHVEYGDGADNMGQGATAHWNAYEKENLGWLNNNGFPPIQTITTSGTYTIDAYETQNMNVKALKILKSNNANGSQDYYYLEARKAIGSDTFLGSCTNGCNYTQGVDFHIGNTFNPSDGSHLINMAYNSGNPAKVALLTGQTFTDTTAANGGVSFTVTSVTASGATVAIQVGAQPPVCTHNAETITITPNTTQVVNAGGSAPFVITIKNNDTSTCAANSYTLSNPVLPTTLKAVLDKNSLSINPGASATATLTLTSSLAAITGTYPVKTTVINTTISTNAPIVLTATLGVN